MDRGFFGWIVYILEEYWPYFLRGTWITLVIAVLGTLIGFVLGFLIGMVESVPMPEKGNPLKKLFLWIKAQIKRHIPTAHCNGYAKKSEQQIFSRNQDVQKHKPPFGVI